MNNDSYRNDIPFAKGDECFMCGHDKIHIGGDGTSYTGGRTVRGKEGYVCPKCGALPSVSKVRAAVDATHNRNDESTDKFLNLIEAPTQGVYDFEDRKEPVEMRDQEVEDYDNAHTGQVVVKFVGNDRWYKVSGDWSAANPPGSVVSVKAFEVRSGWNPNSGGMFASLIERKITRDSVYISDADNKKIWGGKLRGMQRGQKYYKRTANIFNKSDDGLTGTAKIQNMAVKLVRDRDGGEWQVA